MATFISRSFREKVKRTKGYSSQIGSPLAVSEDPLCVDGSGEGNAGRRVIRRKRRLRDEEGEEDEIAFY